MELFSQPEGSIFSPELALATGYVALEAAQLEDTLGELVVLYAQLARETAGPDGATEPQNQEAAPKLDTQQFEREPGAPRQGRLFD